MGPDLILQLGQETLKTTAMLAAPMLIEIGRAHV